MMKTALWLLALFASAVGLALFATHSEGTVTLFWPPHRIDLSLNLALVLLLLLFVLCHLTLRAANALAQLPSKAKAWRMSERQQAMNSQLRQALAQLLAGRFARAKKQALMAHHYAQGAALNAQTQADSLEVQAMALLIAAESAQCMQEASERERLLQAALAVPLPKHAVHFHEGAALRSARWMMDEHDPQTSLRCLAALSQGAQRRTLALRLKLRALQLAKQHGQALETARLLAKHGAFSPQAAQSIVKQLAIETLSQARDADQLSASWQSLPHTEQLVAEVAAHASLRLMNFSTQSEDTPELRERARAWLEPVWQAYPQLSESAKISVVKALEASFVQAVAHNLPPSLRAASDVSTVDLAWLGRIERAQRQLPQDMPLTYLAGMVCMHRQLWGKAQQLLQVCAAQLSDEGLRRRAWRSLAQLAHQRGDGQAAQSAWQAAAK